MKRLLVAVAGLLAAAVFSACGGARVAPPAGSTQSFAHTQYASSGAPLNPFVRVQPDGTVVHLHLSPQEAALFPFARSRNVTYHGGPVVHASTAYGIFWRPSGTYMSPLYESTIEDFYDDIGGTPQYNILTQYYDTTGHISNSATFGGAWTDTSAYPSNFGNGGTGDADLHAEVLKAISANHWPNGGVAPIFFIFTARNAPDDNWAACAYHGSFQKNGVNYLYSIVPYQHDYGSNGCGTKTNGHWPNDRDGDQTVDTMWHEYAESVSDPITTGGKGAWYNANGAEIGDICQTSYGPLRSDGSNVTDGDSRFVTQMIWSNQGSHCVQTL